MNKPREEEDRKITRDKQFRHNLYTTGDYITCWKNQRNN
jgi:hypothetical protein